MSIRKARIEDSPAIAALSTELGYPSSAAEIAARLEPLLASVHDVVCVAIDSDEVVGWIHVSVMSMVEMDPFAEIRGLVVAATHRSRGIGTSLVEEAEKWARDRGCSRIRVRSNVVRERAHAFYKREGYSVIKAQNVFNKPL